ncbi:MASE3 domain-containing protein [uncultured Pseudoteredinibacter sp.]|uniref:MASE3 domain-containing protein n=1 Tax=uncultured Pseudoteredinibacter sp. TaxID=1641701 RepID=UPI00262215D4|nr:MASE3 domain-containing protein [uncultured Pseudoteredinibacter sp.]
MSEWDTKNFKAMLFIAVFAVCFLPFLASTLGVDFATPGIQSQDSDLADIEKSFLALRGGLVHALLEWSAVTIALLVMIISLLHYYFHRDITIPIIGTALLCAGFTDAFHTLAAMRIIEAKAENSDFIPFTWALSRMFNGAIILVGSILCIWLLSLKSPKEDQHWKHGAFLSLIILIFILIAYFVVNSAAMSSDLPKTTFSEGLISRPFDVLPLLLFSISGILFWSWHNAKETVFRYALILSVIPNIATQLHMAFGSEQLFDNHFNIAHSLKVLSYFIVLIGIAIDAIVIFKDSK